MKEVIKRVEPKKYQKTCDCCSSIISFTMGDVDNEFTNYGEHAVMECPVCNRNMFMYSGLVAARDIMTDPKYKYEEPDLPTANELWTYYNILNNFAFVDDDKEE